MHVAGSRHKLQRINGKLKMVDQVTGETSNIDSGELWHEICTAALEMTHGDSERARRRALASFKGMTGRWPRQAFKALKRPPDPDVVELMERSLKAWQVAQQWKERQMEMDV